MRSSFSLDHRQPLARPAGGQFISGMSIPTAEDTATVRFAWREIGSGRDLGTAYIPQVVLPALAKRHDLPLLSSIDESDPSYFGPEDMLQLEAELVRLLAERPSERRDIEAAMTLVRSCRATAETLLLITPL